MPARPVVRPVSSDDSFFQFYRALPMPHRRLGASSMGSGFIVSPDGVILTNAHLVRDANRVAVTLADRQRFSGRVIAVDLLTDVAVIKIESHDLPTVELGNSNDVFTGEPILALGAPYSPAGDTNEAAGMISALGRSGSLVPFIRTAIQLHPGGSGGPLLDSCGRVVGINAQVYSDPKKRDVGTLFAIPINVALSVKSEVVRDEPMPHSFLGIDSGSSSPLLNSMLQRPLFRGALVERAISDGTAACTGLRPGDLILRYNGDPVVDLAHLRSKIALTGSAQGDTLELLRGNSVVSARLNLCHGLAHLLTTLPARQHQLQCSRMVHARTLASVTIGKRPIKCGRNEPRHSGREGCSQHERQHNLMTSGHLHDNHKRSQWRLRDTC